jgi:hypothetical protein
MTGLALYHTVFWLVVAPIVILSLGIRGLRKNWLWLVYSAIVGVYLYHVWTTGVTIGMLILILPIGLFGYYLKRKGLY